MPPPAKLLRIAWRDKCAYSARVRACRATIFVCVFRLVATTAQVAVLYRVFA
jgi:hypothetical protein